MWAGVAANVPTGWLICDGQAVSRTTFADLFAEIGTTYGVGDTTTTFNLPDFRAKAPMGVNDAGLPNGADGTYTTRNEGDGHPNNNSIGTETHTLTESEMPAHTHGPGAGTEFQNKTSPGGEGHAGGPDAYTGFETATTASTGGGGAHANVQPSAVVNFIIKT